MVLEFAALFEIANDDSGTPAYRSRVVAWLRLFDMRCATMFNIATRSGVNIMKSEMLSTRIDHDTKVAFTNICDEIGLSPSQALKLFVRAVINHGGIPFELKARQPNGTTAAAINELVEGKGKQSPSIDDMFNELTEGKVRNAHP